MKLVLFGAGKIGRSFIGQLFSRSGYEVVFIDKDRQLVDALNIKRSYNVFICDKHSETIVVENVSGVYVDDHQNVAEEIASADVLAVSIGKAGLLHIIPVLSMGLLLREKKYPGRILDIILAENMRNADAFFYESLSKMLPDDFPLDKNIGLVETSIGKMVPLATKRNNDDILSVAAEAYNTLIVDKKAFKNPIPDVAGLEAKDHIKAWVDRKLFIHNFGHAAVAYLGYRYHPDKVYLWEALEDKEIRNMVKAGMTQSAEVLHYIYPCVFTREDLYEHIEDLLSRFANVDLADTIFRVGCDLYRKLAPDDRIVVPLLTALQNNLPYEMIIQVFAAALHFKATGADGQMFPADADFHMEFKNKGIEGILRDVCGFTDDRVEKLRNDIHTKVKIQL